MYLNNLVRSMNTQSEQESGLCVFFFNDGALCQLIQN